jgi:rod shape determining protein RodA
VLFVLALAGVLADRSVPVTSVRAPLRALMYGLPAIALVFVQPDFGTALVYAAALGGVLFFAGVRWLHLAVLFVVTVVAALMILWILPSAGVNVLKPYQTARLTGFTHPSNDPRGATYNLRQSITAVGAGGLRGRGVLGATQTRLNYLPAHSTDFAFASLAEEHGFFGAAILLLLYLLVVWRALKVVTVASDLFSAIVAGAIAFMFLFQVFVNSAMTMGIAPITGIPLPFVSVGGSSMLTNFLALGVLQAIYLRRVDRRRA